MFRLQRSCFPAVCNSNSHQWGYHADNPFVVGDGVKHRKDRESGLFFSSKHKKMDKRTLMTIVAICVVIAPVGVTFFAQR